MLSSVRLNQSLPSWRALHKLVTSSTTILTAYTHLSSISRSTLCSALTSTIILMISSIRLKRLQWLITARLSSSSSCHPSTSSTTRSNRFTFGTAWNISWLRRWPTLVVLCATNLGKFREDIASSSKYSFRKTNLTNSNPASKLNWNCKKNKIKRKQWAKRRRK